MPSAMPRNIENDPSVTINGGRFSREIAKAFKLPPRQPASSAATAAHASERCQSRNAAPKMTAASAIMEPTERSIPPVTITGVIARASNPSSTLNRVISKKLLHVKKFFEITENTAISANRANARTHSPFGNRRSRHGLCAAGGKAICMSSRSRAQPVDHDRCQNDRALHRALPISADAEKRKCGADRPEEDHAQQRSQHRARSARNRGTAHYHRCDHLQLEAEPGIARNLVESDRI